MALKTPGYSSGRRELWGARESPIYCAVEVDWRERALSVSYDGAREHNEFLKLKQLSPRSFLTWLIMVMLAYMYHK